MDVLQAYLAASLTTTRICGLGRYRKHSDRITEPNSGSDLSVNGGFEHLIFHDQNDGLISKFELRLLKTWWPKTPHHII